MTDVVTERTGFLFEGTLEDVDPSTSRITTHEESRQVNKLIMIASESAAPAAVREALSTVFTDLYAEGYPSARSTRESEDLLSDIPYQTSYHERYSDRRYYKGTEYADLVELLAQERIRQLFAPNRYPANGSTVGPDQIQANVQPLSGANANTAVYMGLLQAGDTIMGMNLAQGGHLSHGSPVNISGKLFKVIAYGVDPATGRIDYDEVERLAREHNPRMIVSGASAYPWGIDFGRLRRICDGLPRKAYLLADVSHPAGLVAAGLFPNPVGVADVTTFTTHKTLIGPRAAVILTTNETLARRIDRAVFPGLQGGPHMNTIAALAVAFKIAQGEDFNELQRTIVANAKALAETLERRGLTLAYGGTESHLLLVDLRAIRQESGVPLNGDVAARILDLIGIVCNKNTIFGDTSATHPSGIRLGTPWITQRGLTPDDMRVLGGVIADVLLGIVTFPYFDADESAARGKLPVELFRQSQRTISDLITRRAIGPSHPKGWPEAYVLAPLELGGRQLFDVYGRRAVRFLAEATSGEIEELAVGQATVVDVIDAKGNSLATIGLLRRNCDDFGRDHVVMAVSPADVEDVTWWFRALSSGLVLFDPADPWAKVDGPVAVTPLASGLTSLEAEVLFAGLNASKLPPVLSKSYFVGQRALTARIESTAPRPTQPAIIHTRTRSTMPTDYGDASGEVAAMKTSVGILRETEIGLVEVRGSDAHRFLDVATTNDVQFLGVGSAHYTFFLAPDGTIVIDALLYRVGVDCYTVATHASFASTLVAWLADLASGRFAVDVEIPTRVLPTNVKFAFLSDPVRPDSLDVIGLVGPNAPAVLRALADNPEERRKIGRIRRFTHNRVMLAGISVLVARTSHTGVSQGYELFLSRTSAQTFWDIALAKGADQGIRRVGYDAWRAAGVAAGLPWLGQELGGPDQISPIQAGYGPVVRAHKPFFVGRRPLLAQSYPPALEVLRFKTSNSLDVAISEGDLLVDETGLCVGRVTSILAVASDTFGLALATRGTVIGKRLSIVGELDPAVRTPLGRRIGEGTIRDRAMVEVLSRFQK